MQKHIQKFDVIVIGAGSGLNISSAASSLGLNVALVEEGPMGGTCLNRGCIPSKIIIHSADVADIVRNSSVFGLKAKLNGVDFGKVMKRAAIVHQEAKEIEEAVKEDKNVTLFKVRGTFVGKKIVQVGNKQITADKIIIGAGTRPQILPIEGIEDVHCITSDEALWLKKLPKSMIVLGGGYIAAELAHFYRAMGTKVTVVQRSEILVKNEDENISRAFTRIFKKRHNVITGFVPVKAEKKGKSILLTISNSKITKKIEAEQLLMATGRIPNTDILEVAKTGVRVRNGFVETNEYMETDVKGIWAFGDIAGKYQFKHSANDEADIVIRNALYGQHDKVNYKAMPHAIFSSPQVAGVGEREQDLKVRKADYVVGEHKYYSTGMGLALEDKEGFVRVYADRKTKKILGCHVLGTDASTVVHEAVLAMRYDITAEQLADAIHIHPALSEVLQRACVGIEWG